MKKQYMKIPIEVISLPKVKKCMDNYGYVDIHDLISDYSYFVECVVGNSNIDYMQLDEFKFAVLDFMTQKVRVIDATAAVKKLLEKERKVNKNRIS